MKNILTIILLTISFVLSAQHKTVFYVATDGDDGAGVMGTIDDPFLSWDRANDSLQAGDTLYIRGGEYTANDFDGETQFWQYRFTDIHGSITDTIKIMNYPKETPVWTLNGGTSGSAIASNAILIDNCDYVIFRGLTVDSVAHDPPTSSFVSGFSTLNSKHVTLDRCVASFMAGHGFKFGNESYNLILNTRTSDSILVLNCDSYGNEDPETGYGGADGFNITHNTARPTLLERNTWVPNITFRGCRAYFNSDDGWDNFRNDTGLVTIENCWAFYNGYHYTDTSATGDGQGYKMGPNDTIIDKYQYDQFLVKYCLAVHNRDKGFDQNTTVDRTSSNRRFYQNIAYDNVWGFFYYDISEERNNPDSAIMNNNIGYANTSGSANANYGVYKDGGGVIRFPYDSANSWNVTAPEISDADFKSLDDSVLSGARQSNGNLPVIDFLTLAVDSDLRDAGITYWGLPYGGSAPDIGIDSINWIYGSGNPEEPSTPYYIPNPYFSLGGSSFSINGKKLK